MTDLTDFQKFAAATAAYAPDTETSATAEALAPAPAPAEFSADKPVDELSERELEVYYHAHLIGKPHHTMSTRELQMLARYGTLVAQRRGSIEQAGEQAELAMVRQAVRIQAEYQGMAAYLQECYNRTLRDLQRGNPTDEVRVTFQFGEHALELSMSRVIEAFKSPVNTKTNQFQRLLLDMLKLAREVGQGNINRINNSNGRNWTTLTSDITWSGFAQTLRNEDHA